MTALYTKKISLSLFFEYILKSLMYQTLWRHATDRYCLLSLITEIYAPCGKLVTSTVKGKTRGIRPLNNFNPLLWDAWNKRKGFFIFDKLLNNDTIIFLYIFLSNNGFQSLLMERICKNAANWIYCNWIWSG